MNDSVRPSAPLVNFSPRLWHWRTTICSTSQKLRLWMREYQTQTDAPGSIMNDSVRPSAPLVNFPQDLWHWRTTICSTSQSNCASGWENTKAQTDAPGSIVNDSVRSSAPLVNLSKKLHDFPMICGTGAPRLLPRRRKRRIPGDLWHWRTTNCSTKTHDDQHNKDINHQVKVQQLESLKK